MPEELNNDAVSEQDSFFDTDMSDIFGDEGGTPSDDSAGTNANAANGDGNQQSQTQDDGNGDNQQQGFERNFFGEDGTFRADEAMSFITENLPNQYEGVQDIATQMRSPVPPQPTAKQQDGQTQEEWEREYEAQRTARENHFKPYFTYRELLQKASAEGYEGNELLRRADQLAQEQAEEEWGRKQFKEQHERRIFENKRIEEERRFSELIPKSRTNLGLMYNKFKTGESGFNELMFGREIKDASGKVVGKTKGYGEDAINYAFKLSTFGQELPKDPAEFKKFADDWWIRFTSDLQNLQHIMDIALSRLNLHTQKYSAAALKKQGAAEAKRLSQAAAGGKPSPIQKTKAQNPPSDGKGDPLSKFTATPDFVDSV